MGKNFDSVGLMIDCSRNAIKNIDTIKKLIDLMSIMGYDSLQLYTEDTYEVENEPYFGYQRGRYTIKEIQELDAYAKSKNIKLIPCIQTLAHLNVIFKWGDYYKVNDVSDILLIDEPETYKLIENMFRSLRKAYSSNIIHIGMDEAWLVGRGKHEDKHGSENRYDLLLRHLQKVVEIAKKYDFKPLIWSDMFTREAKGVENFDFEKAKKEISKLADLVYWNYYTSKKQVYDNDLDFHHKLCDNTWFAGGLWCWGGFAPFNKYSIENSKVAIESCIEKKVKNVFFTMWGDNGAECSMFSLLPSMFYVSCLIKGIDDENIIKNKFNDLFGLNYDDFMLFDSPNNLTKDLEKGHVKNPCKYMLYNDAFLGLHDTTILGHEANLYKEYAKKLNEAKANAKEYKYIFDYLSSLCSVLELKFDLGLKTRKAYKENNKNELRKLLKTYKEVIRRIKKFYNYFRIAWEKENKTYGFEIQDARIGGLIQRLENCRRRLKLYINGKIKNISELDQELLDYVNRNKKGPTYHNNWDENISPSVV